jgi:predicted TIM-barrel fold metal-dependent hydrolase
VAVFDADNLIGDLTVTLDLDVLVGAYPSSDGSPGTPAEVLRSLASYQIETAAVASLRAALFDMRSGNDEVLALTDPAVVPVGTVDLRDPIGAADELDRLAAASVRLVRLFPDEQNIEAGFPSVRYVAKRAAALGLVVLTGGDVRRFWQPFSGLDARVVFLDTHFYHLGDFLVAAEGEPGFHTSTRLLNSPDALETVAARIGAGRMVFGSRTPHAETLVPLLRLATSGLSNEERKAVAGGNARRLIGVAP